MYYINTTGPNHGNPTSNPFPGSVALPDALLMDYINTKGFCTLSLDGDTVTALEVDRDALDAYNAEHPEVELEKPVTMEELQEENKLLKEQVSSLSQQADFHEECIVELANIVYA